MTYKEKTRTQEVIEEHYTRLAEDYDQFLRYSPDFLYQLSQKMIGKLELRPSDKFVDLGGGTGIFLLEIHKYIEFETPTICVDPFQEMLDKIPGEVPIEKLCLDALTFSEEPLTYNKVLIKEAVHHVTDRPRLFRNLYQKLPKNGRLLLVHVPPDIQYPIFRKALERAKTWHANPDELIAQLQSIGFQVERDYLDYPHRIAKEHYFRQVENQFMTVLSSFTENEMAEGLKEMEEVYKDVETLSFIDHFDYLTAVKT